MTACHRSIRDLDPEDWDRLAGDNAFAASAWLAAVETTCRTPIEPRYFTITREGRLAAAAVCYLVRTRGAVETIDDMLFGRLAGWAAWLGVGCLPALVCGPLLGYGWHLGVRDDLDAATARRLREDLLDAIEREAAALDVRVAFTLVTEDERDVRALLEARAYLSCLNAPVAVLDLTFRSFDEYLHSLPQRRRSAFRRQARRCDLAGVVTEPIGEVTAETDARLQALLDINARKHNGRPFGLGAGFIRQLQQAAGSRARVFIARKGDVARGAVVMLVQGRCAFPIAVGVDAAGGADDFTYFVLTYDRLIADAIATGVTRMWYGRGLADVKRRRGCDFVDSWAYVRPTGAGRWPTAAWCRAASAWNRAKARRLHRDGR